MCGKILNDVHFKMEGVYELHKYSSVRYLYEKLVQVKALWPMKSSLNWLFS